MGFAYAIATYSGLSQTSFPTSYATGAQDGGTTLSRSLCSSPTCPSGSWTALVVDSQRAVSAGANTTARAGNGANLFIGDSNGPVSGGITMTANISQSIVSDGSILALSPALPSATTTTYTYAGTGYANPDAVTTTGNGTASTTFSYDKNGNLTQTISTATTTNYAYDYLNRLIASRATGDTATTTYTYDYQGNRISQTLGSTTTLYPNKFYSLTTTGSLATSTLYAYAGDTPLATIDQKLSNGTATGTPITRYIHPDHLGSTYATSDESGRIAQSFDYAPYGALITSSNTGTTTTMRQYIGQFSDQSGLSYLNARYYEGSRGQFLSQDPLFTGDPRQQNLQDPQSLNAYSYSDDNPITKSDPSGKFWWYGFYDLTGYNGVSGAMMKLGEVFGGHERGLEAQAQYASTIRQDSANSGISPSLTNAIIYEEQSHLMPDEVLGREQLFPNLGNGGVGVMQVSGPIGKEYGGYTKAELARDPRKNIAAGTAYLGNISGNVGSTNYTAIGQQYNGSSAYGQRINAQMQNPNYNANIFTTTISGALGYLQQAFAATTQAQRNAVQAVISAFSKK